MFEFKGTLVFDVGAEQGEDEYDFFAVNSEDDFSAVIDYYRALLERFEYFLDGYTTTEGNKALSPNVKAAMKEHNANVCLTFLEEEYVDGISKVRNIAVNRKVSEEKYDTMVFHFYYTSSIANNEYNYFRKAGEFEKKGFYNAAIYCYTTCIKYDPQEALLYGLRGRDYIQTRHYDLAIDDCTRAIKLDPKNAAYREYRGAAYTDKGDYTAALNDFSKVVKMDPNNAAAYISRGIAYEGTGDFIRARADYTKSLELEPDNTLVQERLATLDDKAK